VNNSGTKKLNYQNHDMTKRKNIMTTTIVSNEDTNKIIEELKGVKEFIKKAQKQEELLKQRLYNFMGENEVLIDPETGEESVKWTYSEGFMKFDSKKFQQEKPSVYNKYLFKTEPVRTLRITK